MTANAGLASGQRLVFAGNTHATRSGLMFSQRRRRWTNQKAELVQRLVCRDAAGEKAPVEHVTCTVIRS